MLDCRVAQCIRRYNSFEPDVIAQTECDVQAEESSLGKEELKTLFAKQQI